MICHVQVAGPYGLDFVAAGRVHDKGDSGIRGYVYGDIHIILRRFVGDIRCYGLFEGLYNKRGVVAALGVCLERVGGDVAEGQERVILGIEAVG